MKKTNTIHRIIVREKESMHVFSKCITNKNFKCGMHLHSDPFTRITLSNAVVTWLENRVQLCMVCNSRINAGSL